MEQDSKPSQEVAAEEERREVVGEATGELLVRKELTWEEHMDGMPFGD